MVSGCVVDTSAVIAILFAEPDATELGTALLTFSRRRMSALAHLEASVVTLAKKGPSGVAELDALVQAARLEIVPFDGPQALAARDAYKRFGKGRHPARLNLGDCCSYALARVTGDPLLFKGNDFSQTDLTAVPVSG